MLRQELLETCEGIIAGRRSLGYRPSRRRHTMRSRFSQSSLTNSLIMRPRPRRRRILRSKVLTAPDRAFCSLAGNNTLAPITHSKLVADAARGCCADSQAALSTNPGCKTRSRASAETNSDTSHPRDSSNAGNASSNAAHACSNTASNTADASRNATNTSSDAADSGSNTTRNSANASCCSKRNAASRDAAYPQYLSDDRHSPPHVPSSGTHWSIERSARFGDLNGCRLRTVWRVVSTCLKAAATLLSGIVLGHSRP
jgi:hypothetical protein